MKPWIAISLLMPALIAAPMAKAGPLLAGTFATTFISGTFETSRGETDVTGTGVLGSVNLSSVAGAFTPGGFTPGSYILAPGAVDLSFDILALGETVDFSTANGGGNSFIELFDDGATQQVLLAPAFDNPHLITELALTGAEGSLFDSITDPGSLHLGAGVSLEGGALLSVFQQGGGYLNAADVTPNAVPIGEPPSWALLGVPLTGLMVYLGLAPLVRRRSITSSRP